MNENLNLVEILKGCKPGTIFYSPLFGEVIYRNISKKNMFPINVDYYDNDRKVLTASFCKDGRYLNLGNGECMLFPSKDQRDWSKFTAPWYKKDKCDPNTLKLFDKALARVANDDEWIVTLYGFKHYTIDGLLSCFSCINGAIFGYCIPYNEDTKHLVGTTEEAPEYYRYWED